MLKKIFTFSVACAVLTSTAVEAAGAPMFDNRTRQVVGATSVSDFSGEALFDNGDENLLVARVDSNKGLKGNSIRQSVKAKPAGTRMSLSDLRRQRPQGVPAARIITDEGRPASVAVSRPKQNSSVVPLAPKEEVFEDNDSVFNIETDEVSEKEPISFKGTLEDINTDIKDNHQDTEKFSYKDDISGTNSFSSAGAFINDSVSDNRISSVPAVREESDYQLLDYTNGVFNKIYTKVGYATVVILPPGEKLNRVTLGDRQRFNVQSVFDKSSGCWHIYLKPMQMDIETNMVIATNRHLFNATLATSDFFKPFAKWINVPGAVESVEVEDGALDLAVKDVNQLNFKYTRQGKADFSWGPLNVFDDKNGHTFMNFDASALAKNRPLVFTRGIDGEMKMVPFAVYRNTYVIDNIYDNLEVRSGSKSIRFVKRS